MPASACPEDEHLCRERPNSGCKHRTDDRTSAGRRPERPSAGSSTSTTRSAPATDGHPPLLSHHDGRSRPDHRSWGRRGAVSHPRQDQIGKMIESDHGRSHHDRSQPETVRRLPPHRGSSAASMSSFWWCACRPLSACTVRPHRCDAPSGDGANREAGPVRPGRRRSRPAQPPCGCARRASRRVDRCRLAVRSLMNSRSASSRFVSPSASAASTSSSRALSDAKAPTVDGAGESVESSVRAAGTAGGWSVSISTWRASHPSTLPGPNSRAHCPSSTSPNGTRPGSATNPSVPRSAPPPPRRLRSRTRGRGPAAARGRPA